MIIGKLKENLIIGKFKFRKRINFSKESEKRVTVWWFNYFVSLTICWQILVQFLCYKLNKWLVKSFGGRSLDQSAVEFGLRCYWSRIIYWVCFVRTWVNEWVFFFCFLPLTIWSIRVVVLFCLVFSVTFFANEWLNNSIGC